MTPEAMPRQDLLPTPEDLAALAASLRRELEDVEAALETARRRLGELSPLPVHWRTVPCGRGCARCPHGPYPYLRVKKGGKWRWKYLRKGWQPPEGFVRPGEFRKELARYHELLRRREGLLEALLEAERSLANPNGRP